MADPYVRQARNVFTATIGSTDVVAGDMLYFDGTDWELADADDNTKFAEAIATNSFKTTETGTLCTRDHNNSPYWGREPYAGDRVCHLHI